MTDFPEDDIHPDIKNRDFPSMGFPDIGLEVLNYAIQQQAFAQHLISTLDGLTPSHTSRLRAQHEADEENGLQLERFITRLLIQGAVVSDAKASAGLEEFRDWAWKCALLEWQNRPNPDAPYTKR